MSANYKVIVCVLLNCLYWQGSLSQSLALTFASPATIDENSAAGTSVQALAASDGTPQYTYTLVTASDEFVIDSANLNVKAGAKLDFETTNTYTLEIQVVDNAVTPDTATGTLTVSITDVNEPPKFSGPFSACVNKAATADTLVTTVTATDPDASEVLKYAITGGNNDGVFKFDAASGAISAAKSVPATPKTYTLTYTATDDETPTAASATVTITVTVGDPCPAVPNHGNVNNGNNGNNENNVNGNQNTNTTQNQNGNFAARSQCNIYVPLLGVAMAVLKSIL